MILPFLSWHYFRPPYLCVMCHAYDRIYLSSFVNISFSNSYSWFNGVPVCILLLVPRYVYLWWWHLYYRRYRYLFFTYIARSRNKIPNNIRKRNKRIIRYWTENDVCTTVVIVITETSEKPSNVSHRAAINGLSYNSVMIFSTI